MSSACSGSKFVRSKLSSVARSTSTKAQLRIYAAVDYTGGLTDRQRRLTASRLPVHQGLERTAILHMPGFLTPTDYFRHDGILASRATADLRLFRHSVVRCTNKSASSAVNGVAKCDRLVQFIVRRKKTLKNASSSGLDRSCILEVPFLYSVEFYTENVPWKSFRGISVEDLPLNTTSLEKYGNSMEYTS